MSRVINKIKHVNKMELASQKASENVSDETTIILDGFKQVIKESSEMDDFLDLVYDKSTDYQYLIYLREIAKQLGAKLIIEVGSYIGLSAKHFAQGIADHKGGGLIVCVDSCISVEEKTFKNLNRYHPKGTTGIKNALKKSIEIKTVAKDSAIALDSVKKIIGRKKADILFLDATHQFNQVWNEYEKFRPLVKQGGIIILDDIKVHPQMEYFWSLIKEPKIEANELHSTGFGVVLCDHAIKMPKYEDAVKDCPPLN